MQARCVQARGVRRDIMGPMKLVGEKRKKGKQFSTQNFCRELAAYECPLTAAGVAKFLALAFDAAAVPPMSTAVAE
jgi:hypothetical protein